MVDNKRTEVVILLIMLVLNLGFIFYVLNSGSISGFAIFNNNKINSPSDFIKEDQISFEDGKIIISLDHAVLSRYTNSESMLPILGKDSTGIGIKPNSSDEINVGDIVSFKQDNQIIVHRIIEKGIDKEGVYFITKGDNSNEKDNMIRFKDIDSVLVAILY
jgi:signal peptidase I